SPRGRTPGGVAVGCRTLFTAARPYSRPRQLTCMNQSGGSVSVGPHPSSSKEQAREQDLVNIFPPSLDFTLDVAARTGHFSKILSERAKRVVALDLTPPTFRFPRVDNIAADIRHLPFADSSFDLVFCTEVLEHVPGVE